MSGQTTETDVPVVGTAPDDWDLLSKLPSTQEDGIALYDVLGNLVIARSHAEYGPVETISTGDELAADPLVSKESVETALSTYGLQLPDDTVDALFDWYSEMVSEVICDDAYDAAFKTMMWDGVGYAASIDEDALADEIESEVVCSRTRAERIAETVHAWREKPEAEPDAVREFGFAARLTLP